MFERDSALEFRRRQRRSPDGDRSLLDILRSADLARVRFRRQHPIGPYALDLYDPERRVAFEVRSDRLPTPEERFHEDVRARFLATHGIRLVAFTEREVIEDRDRVARLVARELAGADARAPVCAGAKAAARGQALPGRGRPR